MKEKYEVVGKRVPKVDAIDKAIGRPLFVTDVELPGMLHGKLLRCPYGHAKVKKIDTIAAEKMPGVRAVITFKDTPKTKFNPWLDSPNWVEPRDRLILTDEPLYNGDAIAAIAAVDEETAIEALELIKVEYEVLPAAYDALESMKPGAPQLHKNYKNNIAVAATDEDRWHKGDVRKGFEEADFIASGSFETKNMQHAPMERHCCVADYDVFNNDLTVYSGTQNPFPLMSRIKFVFNFDIPVRVIARPVGGGFGGNHQLFQHDACAIALSMKTKKPVRCSLSRKEVFQINKRYGSHLDCKIGCKKDGKLIAIQANWIANAGAYAVSTAANMSFPLNEILTVYSYPNVKMEARGIYTNTNPNVPFRGFGSPQAFFGVEQLIDELAEKVGIDPVEFRELNIKKVGDIAVASNTKITSTGMLECLRSGKEKIGWKAKRKQAGRSGTKKRGIGMACLTHCSGCTNFTEGWNESSSAVVYINGDGFATLVTGASEIGQGIWTALLQIVAEELGIPFERVRLQAKYSDTSVQPWDWGSFGSRSCFIVGMATKMAAAKAKEELLKYASEMLDEKYGDLEIRDGNIYVKGSSRKAKTFKEVAIYATELSGHAGQVMGHFTYSPTENPPPFGAQFAEVEVDTETGKVDILNFVAAQDVGTAINPTIVEGQIEGSLVQGIGFAMTEELKWDNDGRLKTDNYLDYVVPRSLDVPKILECIIVETNDPTGPFGAKGVGEPSMVPTAAAIANAIYDATGVRFKNLPMSAESILKGLGKA